MSGDIMFFTPGAHLQAGLSHNPLKAIVSPRPIGWISSRGKDGSVNLAPYSYFNAIAEQPPMVMFSSAPAATHQRTLYETYWKPRNLL